MSQKILRSKHFVMAFTVANEEAMKMLEEIDSVDDVKSFIDNKLENKEKIMGFGHAVYSVKDPRSDIIKSYSEKLSIDHKDKILHDAAVVSRSCLVDRTRIQKCERGSVAKMLARGVRHEVLEDDDTLDDEETQLLNQLLKN